MLEIIGAGASGKATQDWTSVWRESEEATNIQKELDKIHARQSTAVPQGADDSQNKSEDTQEFAMPFTDQVRHVVVRVFQQYWRDPGYIFAKLLLGLASSLFIGFSFFLPDNSIQGFQNVLFSTFMMTSIFATLVQQ